MANYSQSNSVSGGLVGPAAPFLTRSATFLQPGFAVWFDDFTRQALNTGDWAVVGGPTIGTALRGGVLSFPGGAGQLIHRLSNRVATTRTQKWHVGGRAKFGAAVGGTDVRGLMLSDGTVNNLVGCGIFGAISTTKFSFRVSAAGLTVSALSTVSIDTSLHALECWWDGTSCYGSVDNETPVLITNTITDMPNVGLAERHGQDTAGVAVDLIDVTYAAGDRG